MERPRIVFKSAHGRRLNVRNQELPMNFRTRRRLSAAFALIAAVVFGAKLFKAYHRGEMIQGSVRPVEKR